MRMYDEPATPHPPKTTLGEYQMKNGDQVTVVPEMVAPTVVAEWRNAESLGMVGIIVPKAHDYDHTRLAVRLHDPQCGKCDINGCEFFGRVYALKKEQLRLVAKSLSARRSA
jgi:hypothetical protein